MISAEVKAIEKVASELHEINKKLNQIHKDVMTELNARRVQDISAMNKEIVDGDIKGEGYDSKERY